MIDAAQGATRSINGIDEIVGCWTGLLAGFTGRIKIIRAVRQVRAWAGPRPEISTKCTACFQGAAEQTGAGCVCTSFTALPLLSSWLSSWLSSCRQTSPVALPVALPVAAGRFIGSNLSARKTDGPGCFSSPRIQCIDQRGRSKFSVPGYVGLARFRAAGTVTGKLQIEIQPPKTTQTSGFRTIRVRTRPVHISLAQFTGFCKRGIGLATFRTENNTQPK